MFEILKRLFFLFETIHNFLYFETENDKKISVKTNFSF